MPLTFNFCRFFLPLLFILILCLLSDFPLYFDSISYCMERSCEYALTPDGNPILYEGRLLQNCSEKKSDLLCLVDKLEKVLNTVNEAKVENPTPTCDSDKCK